MVYEVDLFAVKISHKDSNLCSQKISQLTIINSGIIQSSPVSMVLSLQSVLSEVGTLWGPDLWQMMENVTKGQC